MEAELVLTLLWWIVVDIAVIYAAITISIIGAISRFGLPFISMNGNSHLTAMRISETRFGQMESGGTDKPTIVKQNSWLVGQLQSQWESILLDSLGHQFCM